MKPADLTGRAASWIAAAALFAILPIAAAQTPIVVDESNPYFEDFESGNDGWTVAGGLWERGTPSQGNFNAAYSGSNAWATDLDANYPDEADASVVSPTFDFSSLDGDPVVSLAVRRQVFIWNDGARLEMDVGDGQGFQVVGGVEWYESYASNTLSTGYPIGERFWAGLDEPWTVYRNRLTGAAGHAAVQLRVHFRSDNSYGKSGVAFDDVRVEVPVISVSNGTDYFEDFEVPGDGWFATGASTAGQTSGSGPLWEVGSPSQIELAPAHSGSRAWVTDLDDDYPIDYVASAHSPRCDFSQLGEDPVFSFAIKHTLATGTGADGFRLEMDLGTGNGFETVGSTATWYDGGLSSNKGAGGVGWKGDRGTWTVMRHRLTGAAGNPSVHLRVLFSSNIGEIDAGAAFDDVHIYVPTYTGTESLAADDVDYEIHLDGVRSVASSGGHAAAAGQLVELHALSPEGGLLGQNLAILAEVFATGSTFTPVLPDIWVTVTSTTFLLAGATQDPFGNSLTVTAGGFTLPFVVPAGLAGTSLMTQVAVSSGATANGIYATSDAEELRLQ